MSDPDPVTTPVEGVDETTPKMKSSWFTGGGSGSLGRIPCGSGGSGRGSYGGGGHRSSAADAGGGQSAAVALPSEKKKERNHGNDRSTKEVPNEIKT